MKNPAAGGGRWVDVPPERFVSWIGTFARRHGTASVSRDEAGSAVTFTAADGSVAECHPPFPPLSGAAGGCDPAAAAEQIAAHAVADRMVGVLLVRLGGYAAGVFSGAPPRLASSKTGSRPVHGRSAAGGWSQQRFARRRENQAAIALRTAADAAAGVFGRYGADGLDAVVLGGDKRAVTVLRGDARLAPYLDRATERFLTVPDPGPAVLRDIPAAYLAIRVRLTEPDWDGRGEPVTYTGWHAADNGLRDTFRGRSLSVFRPFRRSS